MSIEQAVLGAVFLIGVIAIAKWVVNHLIEPVCTHNAGPSIEISKDQMEVAMGMFLFHDFQHILNNIVDEKQITPAGELVIPARDVKLMRNVINFSLSKESIPDEVKQIIENKGKKAVLFLDQYFRST